MISRDLPYDPPEGVMHVQGEIISRFDCVVCDHVRRGGSGARASGYTPMPSVKAYGPPDRSAAHRRPLSRGPTPCGPPQEPLVSYRINRQLSGWILPLLMIRAFGAHCHEPTYAVQQN